MWMLLLLASIWICGQLYPILSCSTLPPIIWTLLTLAVLLTPWVIQIAPESWSSQWQLRMSRALVESPDHPNPLTVLPIAVVIVTVVDDTGMLVAPLTAPVVVKFWTVPPVDHTW